jgi:glycosyltransferase involved in cell wall biosynthesis
VTIAKNLYVDTRSGWFSDRSACYLASGRPVLAQDTGLEDLLPVGDGLLLFSTPEEAAAGAAEILGDLERHGRAAREIAEEHLAAERVLPRLLEDLGL